MKMKVLFSTVAVMVLSLVFSSKSFAQYHGRHRGYHKAAPRVVIAVRPPVRYSPPPVYYRPYARYRHYGYGNRCARGHYKCNDRACYNGAGYRNKYHDRYDRYDRHYRDHNRGHNRH